MHTLFRRDMDSLPHVDMVDFIINVDAVFPRSDTFTFAVPNVS